MAGGFLIEQTDMFQDLSLSASKRHHLSIGVLPNFRLAISEQGESELIQIFQQINDLGIIMKSVLSPSANILTAPNEVNGMLFFMKRSSTCLTNEVFTCRLMSNIIFSPIYCINLSEMRLSRHGL